MYGYDTSGFTDSFFFAYNADGDVWNGSAFVTWDDGDYEDYKIAAEEVGSSTRYEAEDPPGTLTYELRREGTTLDDCIVVWTGETLLSITSKTDLIGTGTAITSAPVSADGDLDELIIGDDYLAANSRALEWTFSAIVGFTTSATGKFGIKNANDGAEVYTNTSGVVTDIGGGNWKVSFDVPRTALASLTSGVYDYSVEITEGGTEITILRNRQIKYRVAVVDKQT